MTSTSYPQEIGEKKFIAKKILLLLQYNELGLMKYFVR